MSPPRPRDRDHRETKTPPEGSTAAAAFAALRSDDVDSRVGRREDDFDPDEPTDPNADDFEKMKRRAQAAALHSKAALGAIDSLRAETKIDITQQNVKIDTIGTKVDTMMGKVDVLAGLVTQTLEHKLQLQTLTMTKSVEVQTAQAMLPVERERADIERQRTENADLSAKKATIREVVKMIFAAITSVTLLTLLITTMAGKC